MSLNAAAALRASSGSNSMTDSTYIDDEDGDESLPNTKISSKTETDMDFSQWQVGPNGKYRAAARTVANLPSGVYKIEQDDGGLYLQLQNVISDNIVTLPETANTHVLNGMKKFWDGVITFRKPDRLIQVAQSLCRRAGVRSLRERCTSARIRGTKPLSPVCFRWLGPNCSTASSGLPCFL